MPRIAYSGTQKAEAVALARVVGSPAAAEQLGMDQRTVRGWQEKAGYSAEPDVVGDGLQALYDLAVARVTVDVAAGKIRGSALMTVVGIARDKLDRAARWRARVPDPFDSTPADPIEATAKGAFARWAAFVDTLDPDIREDGRLYFSTTLRDELDRRADMDRTADDADPDARNMAVALDEAERNPAADDSPEVWDTIVDGLIAAFTASIPAIRERNARIEARREEGVRLPAEYERLLDEAEMAIANLEESR